MNNYALIQNGIVAEILPKMLDGVDIADRYPARFISEFCVECPDEVRESWTYSDGQFAPPPGPSLEQVKAAKLIEINTKADMIRARVLAPYCQTERDSFGLQAGEAQAYARDPSTPTPTIAAIAAGTGTTVAALVPVILAKAAILIPVISQAQNLRKQLDAVVSDASPAGDAAAVAAVRAIEVEYPAI